MQSETSGSAGSGDLEARLRARVNPRPQAQIASAENEADRLSSGVTATTPEGVKEELGRKLGADFSSVRLHIGGEAESKAASMGARAFTAGSDVYFGPGGFDPAVAAHELVRTAQQGAVEGGSVSVSAPLGGTQMLTLKDFRDKFLKRFGSRSSTGAAKAASGTAPAAHAAAAAAPAATTTTPATTPAAPATTPAAPATTPAAGSTPAGGAAAPAGPTRTERFKSAMKGFGNKAARGATWAWDKTGGRLARWSDEAVEEYTAAKQSGDWDALSRTQKLRWIARNPIASLRRLSASQRSKAEARTKMYEGDVKYVKDYLATSGTGGKKTSLIQDTQTDTGDESGSLADDVESAADRTGDALNAAGAVVGFVDKRKYNEAMKAFQADKATREAAGLPTDNMKEPEEGSKLGTGLGHASAALGSALNIYGMYKSGKDIREAYQQGDDRGVMQGMFSMGNNFVGLAGNLSNFGTTAAAGAHAAGFGIASGTLSAAAGVHQAITGRTQQKTGSEVEQELRQGRDPDAMSDEERLLMHTARQSSMVGTENLIKGVGNTVSGGLDIASGVASLSGGGAIAGGVLTGASLAVKGVTAAASAYQHGRIKSEVSEQTINLNDQMINDILAKRKMEDTPQNRRRIKRAILRTHGYQTGFREELLRDQTAQRSSALANKAEDAMKKPISERTLADKMALKLVGSLGVSRLKTGYSAEAIAKNLGNEDGLGAAQKLRDQNKRITAMARKNREDQAAKAAAAASAAPAATSTAPAAASSAPASTSTAPAAASSTPAPASTGVSPAAAAPAPSVRRVPLKPLPVPPKPAKPAPVPPTAAPAPSAAAPAPVRHTPPRRPVPVPPPKKKIPVLP